MAWLPGALAQQRGNPKRIGLLMPVSAEAAAPELAAFRQGLRDLGYIEGRDVALEYRNAHGKDDLLPGSAAELVQAGVDVILTWGTPAARAAKEATSKIPTVMASADPEVEEVYGKRLEWLRDIAPGLSRVGVLWNPANPSAFPFFQKPAADSLGLESLMIRIQNVGDFEQASATIVRERLDGLTVNEDSLFLDNQTRILDLVATARIPATYPYREFVDHGGLMYFGPNYPDLFRRAATYVDKVLRGTGPGDLTVEQYTKYELIINLKAVKALGLTVPQSLLARADQVIE
jgi:putative tryptophan/tyrosine transport system substrate-binding protein